jgi:hypothetical protein
VQLSILNSTVFYAKKILPSDWLVNDEDEVIKGQLILLCPYAKLVSFGLSVGFLIYNITY